MKHEYDQKTKAIHFDVGERVLVLLPLPGNPLKATFSGRGKLLRR